MSGEDAPPGGQRGRAGSGAGASTALPRPRPGLWRRALAALLRGFYFRLRVVGKPPAPGVRRVVVASHRNGAIDGYLVLAAFPGVNFILSAQLLRHWLGRLMFTGIPVVREKDAARYQMRRQAFANPIAAGVACLEAGGSLAMFPEGSSEWGHRPLPYAPGTARIVRMALERELPLEVVPLGLFYVAPDRFRSSAEVLVGDPVDLPARGSLDKRAWEAQIHQALAASLDAVSVHCPDPATFAAVEALARRDWRQGASYALSFKAHQAALGAAQRQADIAAAANPAAPTPPTPPERPRRRLWEWPCIGVFALLLAPVLLVGWQAGKRADARNTVSFFRIAGGLAAALLWLPVLAVLLAALPWPMAALLPLAVIGWRRWPEN